MSMRTLTRCTMTPLVQPALIMFPIHPYLPTAMFLRHHRRPLRQICMRRLPVSAGSLNAGTGHTTHTIQGSAVMVTRTRRTIRLTQSEEMAQGFPSYTTQQIYWGTFLPSKSMRLAHDALAWSTTPKGKKDKDEATPDSANMVQLLRCFEVYAHAICFFAARPQVALELHDALVRYRIRLMDFSLTFSFESIRTYHYAFMGDRILRGQDDPAA